MDGCEHKRAGERAIEELLEFMWLYEEEGGANPYPEFIKELVGEGDVQELIGILESRELATFLDEKLELTEKGRKQARRVVRCHRLAERLLKDVLDLGLDVSESSACVMEHVLSEEVADSVCALLGHPRKCPHGRPIPEGECCRKAEKEISPVVFPLSDAVSGDELRVAYISTHRHDRLHRLSSLGLLPGAILTLHQRKPSLVVKIGETQLALDPEVARDIYVRRSETGPGARADNDTWSPFRRRRRRQGRRRG
jgi:DtxR family Mn-dependent transcriptional regulator